MPRGTLDLSATELDVVWRAENLGELPLVIDVPSPGKTHAERADLERRVWTELVDREVADAVGQPVWQLRDLLVVVGRRRRSLQLRVFGQNAINAILAVRGRHVALAVLDGRFRIRRVADTGLAATLLSLLPPVPAGTGHSVSVRTTAFASAARADSPGRARDILQRNGLSADDARTLLTMTTGILRTAQVVDEWRDDLGATTRSRPVSVQDTPHGRYRSIRTITGTDDHLTVTPANSTNLAAAVDQLSTDR